MTSTYYFINKKWSALLNTNNLLFMKIVLCKIKKLLSCINHKYMKIYQISCITVLDFSVFHISVINISSQFLSQDRLNGY